MIPTCVQDHKGHKSTTGITALSQRTRGRSAPSLPTLLSTPGFHFSLWNCPQHGICALGHDSSKRHCLYQHRLPEKPFTWTTSPSSKTNISQVANTTVVTSDEKCFPTCLDSFKGSFFFIRSLPLSASLSELPASLLWPFSLGSADTQFSDSLGFLPGCLSHFSFRS